jgi:phosphatidylserine/phosphatidylglycerophosphate/cardiolipin synthase-like enzyme
LPRDIGYDGGTWAVLFSPGARGNQANGQFIIDKLIDTIDAAQTSIDLAVFETNLTPVAEALIRAHERGVVVRWITDDENGRDADGEEGRGQFACWKRRASRCATTCARPSCTTSSSSSTGNCCGRGR